MVNDKRKLRVRYIPEQDSFDVEMLDWRWMDTFTTEEEALQYLEKVSQGERVVKEMEV
jgi:hypothetical protein